MTATFHFGSMQAIRRNLILATLTSALFCSGALAQVPPGSAAAPQVPSTVRVIAFAGGWNLPLWVAERQGFFQRRGVALELAYTPNSSSLVTSLMNGHKDIALASIDNLIAYQEGQGDGPPLVDPDLVAVMGVDSGFLSVIGQRSLHLMTDLRGKRLAVDSLNTGFAFVLRELLHRNGVEDADVTFVRGGATELRFQNLIAGAFDATLLRTPFEILAGERGLNTIATAEALGPYLGTSGFVRRSWATSHEAALIGFMRAYRDAMQWLEEPAHRPIAEALLVAHIRDMTPELAHPAATKLLAEPGGLVRNLELNVAGLRTVLDLRRRYGQPSRALGEPDHYIDMSYRAKALATP